MDQDNIALRDLNTSKISGDPRTTNSSILCNVTKAIPRSLA